MQFPIICNYASLLKETCALPRQTAVWKRLEMHSLLKNYDIQPRKYILKSL